MCIYIITFLEDGGSSMYSKLRELRKSKKYTTEEMGKRLGISKAFYCQIENNKRRRGFYVNRK